MTRTEIFDQDRKEKEVYYNSDPEDEVLLPITKDGFEALLKVCCDYNNLPVDDGLRKVFAGYVHHIQNEQNTTTILALSKILYKSISNALTWQIDQEIKERDRLEAKKLLEINKEDATVLPINGA